MTTTENQEGKPPKKTERELYLTPDEYLKLRQVAYEINVREGLLIDVLALGGLRVTEALMITVDDINPETNMITIHTLKKRYKGKRVDKIDDILYPEETINALVLYCRSRRIRSGKRVFPFTRQRAWQIYKHIISKVPGLSSRLSPHSLRHCHGIMVIEATGDSMLASKRLRHAHIKETERYIHLTNGMQNRIVDGIGKLFNKEKKI